MNFTGAQGTTSLEGLIDYYDIDSDQLDIELEEKDLMILAGYFDNVEFYLNNLGLSKSEQVDVRNAENNQLAVNKSLLLWREHNPSTATLRELVKILLNLRKEEVASSVCNFYYPRQQ